MSYAYHKINKYRHALVNDKYTTVATSGWTNNSKTHPFPWNTNDAPSLEKNNTLSYSNRFSHDHMICIVM